MFPPAYPPDVPTAASSPFVAAVVLGHGSGDWHDVALVAIPIAFLTGLLVLANRRARAVAARRTSENTRPPAEADEGAV